MEYNADIDLSGLTCPLPILKTKAALATMNTGEVLKIIITNPDSVNELHILAKQTGGTIINESEEANAYILLFKKA